MLNFQRPFDAFQQVHILNITVSYDEIKVLLFTLTEPETIVYGYFMIVTEIQI